MANYNCITRTNYFHVTDEEKYKKLFACLSGEDEVYAFDKKINDKEKVFGFGCYGNISYTPENKEDPDDDLDNFYKELQKILPENEAFVRIEIGYEKLRYLIAYADIVTSKKITYTDLNEETVNTVRNLINKKDWHLNITY